MNKSARLRLFRLDACVSLLIRALLACSIYLFFFIKKRREKARFSLLLGRGRNSTSEQPTRMISSSVFGEQRRRQGSVVGVVRVRRVDESMGIAGRQERAGWPGTVQQGRGSRRYGYPGREDQRGAQRSTRCPHRGRQTRQQALRLCRGGGNSSPFLVAGCNRQGILLGIYSSSEAFPGFRWFYL